MYPEEVYESVSIGESRFFNQEEGSIARVVLAAYLLLAGALFVRGVTEEEGNEVIPAEEDLREAGIKRGIYQLIAPRDRVFSEYAPGENFTAGELAHLVTEANEAGIPELAARAVAYGTHSDDELIRVCALGSAVEFFNPSTLDLPGHIVWLLRNARQRQTFELLSTLLARVWSSSIAVATPQARITPWRGGITPGLMTIHGTVLPLSRENCPDWSVPPHGPLFQYLASIRKDIYNQPDYYRWEGGYTDYAREVAIQNLFDWIDRRKLYGIDVVAHSHGCNVVMGSTLKGASYRKMVLMNCPVHWNNYRLLAAAITNEVISVRIKFDLVILMDRAGQRFPPKTIQERVLPLRYTGHGAATQPKTWQREKLDAYL
jgi:hypothetical protein